MRRFGFLCGVGVLALAAACSDEDDQQTTGSLTGNAGAAGASMATAGSGAGGSSGDTSSGDGAAGEGTTPSGLAGAAGAAAGDGDGDGDGDEAPSPTPDAGAPPANGDAGAVDPGDDESMSFFVTSRGGPDGGNFGGLEGADALCTTLAAAVSPELGAKTWRAYLSTSTVDARDRIGTGPWRNAAGVIIANDVDQLVDQGPGGQGGSLDATWPLNDATIALTETGEQIPNNVHDIITGTNLDGTSSGATCNDWTSTEGTATNGHSNRAGGGMNPPSWSSAHTVGCAPTTGNFQQGTVSSGGGRGSIYCFAAD